MLFSLRLARELAPAQRDMAASFARTESFSRLPRRMMSWAVYEDEESTRARVLRAVDTAFFVLIGAGFVAVGLTGLF